MEKSLKELYKEQYDCYPELSQEEIEELYASEGIVHNSFENILNDLRVEIKRKKDQLPTAEDRLWKAIIGSDLETEITLNEINALERKLVDLEFNYYSQNDLNVDVEEELKLIKQEINNKKRYLEEKNIIKKKK